MGKNFSFSFAENISEFMILRRDIEKIRSFRKFCKISLNIQKMKAEFKIAGAWEFWCIQECCSTNDSNVGLLGVRHGGLRCRYGNYRVQWLQKSVQKKQRCQWCVGCNVRKSEIFLQKWTKVYWPIYLVNQWIVLSKPVVSKDQRTGRIKQSNIEVQIHIIIGRKNYGQVSTFGNSVVWWTIKQVESNQKSCKCLQVVSTHKFIVYKAISRPRVNKSSEWDFIKMILTKDQGRGKRNKE